MRSRVSSLESELENLTQRFTVLGQTRDEERTIMEAGRAEASNKSDDLALRLLEARSFIHSSLSLEYGSTNEPSKPQLNLCHLQVEVAKKKEALRVATIEVGTLQALLDIERQGCTSSPSMERELVRLRHSHGRLREIVRDLGFNTIGLLRTYSSNDLILLIDFGRLYRAISNHLGRV